MNATEIILIFLALLSFLVFRIYSVAVSKKSGQNRQSRLIRLKKASFTFQLLIAFGVVMGIYSLLAFLFGWPFFSQAPARMVISHNHIYTSPSEMPPDILALALVKVGLYLVATVALYALFGLYRRGILFSARNVLYIRLQGYCLILGFLIDYQMQCTLRDMDLSMTPVFGGLLIIFIAWIMDEGRKIQEEQELTV